MLEISVIRNNQVIFDNNSITKYVETLKCKRVNHEIMISMENKFISLMNNDKQVKSLYAVATGVAITTINTSMCYAGDLNLVTEKIRQATNPVIELLAGLGYPVTYGMLIVGALMIITGKKSKGLDVIKWACMGYIGLQFVPFLLSLLQEVGKALRESL